MAPKKRPVPLNIAPASDGLSTSMNTEITSE